MKSIDVDGSTIYPPSHFASETQPLLGHEIGLVEVFQLADRITARYRRDGYILSRAVVPAQKIENGTLRIQIVEGYVHGVSFKGPHSRLMEQYAAQIMAARPLRQDIIERYLLLMNALPGAAARAVLAPAQDAPGGTDITIVTTEKTVDAYVSIDNHGSHYLGTLEGSAGVGLNDLLGLGDRTSFDYATAYPNATLHEHELNYFEGREDLPLGHDGLLLSLWGERITGTPGLTLAPLDTRTSGTSGTALLSYPIISSRAATWTTALTLSYLNSRADIDNQPYQPPSYDDRIRAVRAGTTYDFADRFGGHNLLDLTLSQGLPVPDAHRAGVTPTYPGPVHPATFINSP